MHVGWGTLLMAQGSLTSPGSASQDGTQWWQIQCDGINHPPAGHCSVSSGTTKLSVLGSLVNLVHVAEFKSARCESSLGGQGDTAGAVAARPPGRGRRKRGSWGPGVPSALPVPWKPPHITHHAWCLQDWDSLCLPSFLLLPAQPCLPSHGTQS